MTEPLYIRLARRIPDRVWLALLAPLDHTYVIPWWTIRRAEAKGRKR